jgi:hypothetical protein
MMRHQERREKEMVEIINRQKKKIDGKSPDKTTSNKRSSSNISNNDTKVTKRNKLTSFVMSTISSQSKFIDFSKLSIQQRCATIQCGQWGKRVFGYIKDPENNDVDVGNFDFKPDTGQMGGLFLETKYRCKGLEMQIWKYVMKQIVKQSSSCPTNGEYIIWEVVNEDEKDSDTFFGKLKSKWGFEYRHPVHWSVTCGGYIMNIPTMNDFLSTVEAIDALPLVEGAGIYERRRL